MLQLENGWHLDIDADDDVGGMLIRPVFKSCKTVCNINQLSRLNGLWKGKIMKILQDVIEFN